MNNNRRSLVPSGSTQGSILAGALATVTMAILGKFHITFDAGVESALVVIFTVLGGYLPPSGRR